MINCHLCSSTEGKESHSGYQECSNCGLLYKDPIHISDYNSAYSSNKLFDYISYDRGQWQIWNSIKANICLDIVDKFNLSSIFDFGCGTGSFLSACRLISTCQLSGLEVSSSALKIAQEQIDSCKIYNSFSEASLHIPRNSLATFFEVIEHLDDFSPLEELLSKGCHVYGTTGNHHSWVAKIKAEKWDYLMPQHCSIFSLKSFVYLSEKYNCHLHIRRRNILPRRDIFPLSARLPVGPFNNYVDLAKYFLPSSTITFHIYPK